MVTANIVPSSSILVTLMIGKSHSSEKSVLARAKQRHLAEDGILGRFSRFIKLLHVCLQSGIGYCLLPVHSLYTGHSGLHFGFPLG
jgi:hypothetical protein